MTQFFVKDSNGQMVEVQVSGRGRSTGAKALIAQMLTEGTHTADEIFSAVLTALPDVKPSTIRTYLTDARNPKYSPFTHLVQVGSDRILRFSDIRIADIVDANGQKVNRA